MQRSRPIIVQSVAGIVGQPSTAALRERLAADLAAAEAELAALDAATAPPYELERRQRLVGALRATLSGFDADGNPGRWDEPPSSKGT